EWLAGARVGAPHPRTVGSAGLPIAARTRAPPWVAADDGDARGRVRPPARVPAGQPPGAPRTRPPGPRPAERGRGVAGPARPAARDGRAPAPAPHAGNVRVMGRPGVRGAGVARGGPRCVRR